MVSDEPSSYMQTLTRYLSNIMNSTLLGLPREIKELIYFDALSHAANRILVINSDRLRFGEGFQLTASSRAFLFLLRLSISMLTACQRWHRMFNT